jgi:hypothetical protein
MDLKQIFRSWIKSCSFRRDCGEHSFSDLFNWINKGKEILLPWEAERSVSLSQFWLRIPQNVKQLTQKVVRDFRVCVISLEVLFALQSSEASRTLATLIELGHFWLASAAPRLQICCAGEQINVPPSSPALIEMYTGRRTVMCCLFRANIHSANAVRTW